MIKFESEAEKDFYNFLVSKKGCKEGAAESCIVALRKIQPLDKLINLCLERTINILKCLVEYQNANPEKFGWGAVMARSTPEELADLHRWMRKD